MYPLLIAVAASFYAALVFGAGLLFGAVQSRLIEPAWEVRTAELLEAPVMAALALAAGRVVARVFRHTDWQSLFLIGILGAALEALADVWLGAAVWGLSPAEILFKRDPVEGAIYYFLIGLVAIAPALFGLGRVTAHGHALEQQPLEE